MAIFTADWFSHNIPAWTHYFKTLGWDGNAAKTVVEIGCFEGRASLWILDNLLLHPKSRLHCVDVFADHGHPGSYWERFKSNVLQSENGSKVRKHIGSSFAFLNRFVADANSADFIYVDGAHRAANVLEDLILSFRALKPGGLLICDDYLYDAKSERDTVLGSPKIAIDAFTTIYRDQIQIIVGQPLYQMAFIKRAERTDDDPWSRRE